MKNEINLLNLKNESLYKEKIEIKEKNIKITNDNNIIKEEKEKLIIEINILKEENEKIKIELQEKIDILKTEAKNIGDENNIEENKVNLSYIYYYIVNKFIFNKNFYYYFGR